MKFDMCVRAAFIGGVLAVAGSASAVPIVQGLYRLHNHPDGGERPPLYGARLDELFDVTANHDVFTFDFDNVNSAMYLTFNGSEIHIWGQAMGGRDVGTHWDNDQYLGMYAFNFTYRWGVGLAPGDDDLLVDPGTHYNYGSVITPTMGSISLHDGHYGDGQPDFRFGDEDNDLGHRGFNGMSGWGWIFHGGHDAPYIASSDWLFTATLAPTPGSLALFGLGAAVSLRRRR